MALVAAMLVAASLSDAEAREILERAIAHHKERRWEEAVAGYRELVTERPDLVAARIYLGEVLWLSGRDIEAREELERARTAAPKLLLPLLLQTRLDAAFEPELARELPEPPLRARLFRDVAIESEVFIPVERPTLLLFSVGSVDRALDEYRAAAEADPWNADLHRHAGSALFRASRSTEAASAFERVVSLEPGDASAWGQLGSAYLRLMWWDSAIEALEKAKGLAGEQPAGLLALGYAYERRPDFERALLLYRRASELAPRWAQAHYRAGRVFIKLDRIDEAEGSLRRALELDPNMAEAACFLGAIFLDRQDVPSATRELERAVALRPSYAKAYFYLGQAYQRAERTEEAKRALATYERLMAQGGAVEPP